MFLRNVVSKNIPENVPKNVPENFPENNASRRERSTFHIPVVFRERFLKLVTKARKKKKTFFFFSTGLKLCLDPLRILRSVYSLLRNTKPRVLHSVYLCSSERSQNVRERSRECSRTLPRTFQRAFLGENVLWNAERA